MHMRTFEQNRLWSWGWSLSSRGRITARTGFNYFYGDWLISPSAMEPIRFSQKCKPSPTSPPDMLRNALNVIQRISISNRPWSGGSPYFWHDDVLMLLLPPPPSTELHLTLCSDTLHTAVSFHSCPHCLIFASLSLPSFFFSLSFACCLSQLLQIAPMPGNRSHVSYFNFHLLQQAACSAQTRSACWLMRYMCSNTLTSKPFGLFT